MRKRAKETPQRLLWDIIKGEACMQGMTQEQLGKLIGVTRGTVCNDAADPARIPLGRVFLYFAALGIDAEVLLRPLAYGCADNRFKK